MKAIILVTVTLAITVCGKSYGKPDTRVQSYDAPAEKTRSSYDDIPLVRVEIRSSDYQIPSLIVKSSSEAPEIQYYDANTKEEPVPDIRVQSYDAPAARVTYEAPVVRSSYESVSTPDADPIRVQFKSDSYEYRTPDIKSDVYEAHAAAPQIRAESYEVPADKPSYETVPVIKTSYESRAVDVAPIRVQFKSDSYEVPVMKSRPEPPAVPATADESYEYDYDAPASDNDFSYESAGKTDVDSVQLDFKSDNRYPAPPPHVRVPAVEIAPIRVEIKSDSYRVPVVRDQSFEAPALPAEVRPTYKTSDVSSAHEKVRAAAVDIAPVRISFKSDSDNYKQYEAPVPVVSRVQSYEAPIVPGIRIQSYN